MVRKILSSLLLLTFVCQAWAAGDMSAMGVAGSSDTAHCPGQMADDAPGDCCADGAPMGAACEALCNATAALPPAIPEPFAVQAVVPLEFLHVARAGPRYIPLNPPPIS